MSKAPDVTDPDDIRGLPDDPQVDQFKNDPVLVVMHWTPDLKGPQSLNADDDLLGHPKEAVAEHYRKYTAWLDELNWHLSSGRYVVVRDWFPDAQTTWDIGSISKFKGDMHQKVQFQGMFDLCLH
jgi:hypothetical protein